MRVNDVYVNPFRVNESTVSDTILQPYQLFSIAPNMRASHFQALVDVYVKFDDVYVKLY